MNEEKLICIANNKDGYVVRVPRSIAEKMIEEDSAWHYCPKSKWRRFQKKGRINKKNDQTLKEILGI